jgi:hypothetical protein
MLPAVRRTEASITQTFANYAKNSDAAKNICQKTKPKPRESNATVLVVNWPLRFSK